MTATIDQIVLGCNDLQKVEDPKTAVSIYSSQQTLPLTLGTYNSKMIACFLNLSEGQVESIDSFPCWNWMANHFIILDSRPPLYDITAKHCHRLSYWFPLLSADFIHLTHVPTVLVKCLSDSHSF